MSIIAGDDGYTWKDLTDGEILADTIELNRFNVKEKELIDRLKYAYGTAEVAGINPSKIPIIVFKSPSPGQTEVRKQRDRSNTVVAYEKTIKNLVDEHMRLNEHERERITKYMARDLKMLQDIKDAYRKVEANAGGQSPNIPVVQFPNYGVKPANMTDEAWQDMREKVVDEYKKHMDQLARDIVLNPDSEFSKTIKKEKSESLLGQLSSGTSIGGSISNSVTMITVLLVSGALFVYTVKK